MHDIWYYKSSEPDVQAAHAAQRASFDEMFNLGRNFSQRYENSRAIYNSGIDSIGFAGLKFDTPPNKELWTQAAPASGTQRPRKPSGVLKGLREASQRLWDEWELHYPSRDATHPVAPLYDAVGFCVVGLYVAFCYFEHNGYVYMAASSPLKNATEILTSEFIAAAEAAKREK